MLRPLRHPLSLIHVTQTLDESGSAKEKCLPFWSGSGCTQVLTLLDTKRLYRTIDGRLMDVSALTHRKYTTTIWCQDQHPPPLEALWNGMAFWVECSQQLSCSLDPHSTVVTLARAAVPDSVILQRPDLPPTWLSVCGQEVILPDSLPAGSMLTYRPRLFMRLTNFQLETGETEKTTKWYLNLEEI